MDFCVVIVWYNPNYKCVENISKYNKYFKQIYIVDNSKNSNFELINGFTNVKYVPCYINSGISAALNTGCKLAINDGYSWCMTMDQDTIWDDEQICKYLTYVKRDMKINCNVSFAPSFILPDSKISLFSKLKQRCLLRKNTESITCVNSVITSGNIINLDIWNELNGYNELFFIDEVDYDFCFKIVERGYKIIKYSDVMMEQVIGNPEPTILPKETHSPLRIKYMVRNRLYMIQNHPRLCKESHYKFNLLKLFIQIILTFNLKKIIAYFEGISAYNKKMVGMFND